MFKFQKKRILVSFLQGSIISAIIFVINKILFFVFENGHNKNYDNKTYVFDFYDTFSGLILAPIIENVFVLLICRAIYNAKYSFTIYLGSVIVAFLAYFAHGANINAINQLVGFFLMSFFLFKHSEVVGFKKGYLYSVITHFTWNFTFFVIFLLKLIF